MSIDTLTSFDLETSILVSEIYLEEIKSLSEDRKGKKRWDAPLSDEELAFELQQQDFLRLLGVLNDAKVARSLDNAVQMDGDMMERSALENQAAADDHEYAQALSRGDPLPAKSAAQRAVEAMYEANEAEYGIHNNIIYPLISCMTAALSPLPHLHERGERLRSCSILKRSLKLDHLHRGGSRTGMHNGC
jgi:hypothetical protein